LTGSFNDASNKSQIAQSAPEQIASIYGVEREIKELLRMSASEYVREDPNHCWMPCTSG
jgi:PP-loop superfamily ATP-utilizing enzyme